MSNEAKQKKDFSASASVVTAWTGSHFYLRLPAAMRKQTAARARYRILLPEPTAENHVPEGWVVVDAEVDQFGGLTVDTTCAGGVVIVQYEDAEGEWQVPLEGHFGEPTARFRITDQSARPVLFAGEHSADLPAALFIQDRGSHAAGYFLEEELVMEQDGDETAATLYLKAWHPGPASWLWAPGDFLASVDGIRVENVLGTESESEIRPGGLVDVEEWAARAGELKASLEGRGLNAMEVKEMLDRFQGIAAKQRERMALAGGGALALTPLPMRPPLFATGEPDQVEEVVEQGST